MRYLMAIGSIDVDYCSKHIYCGYQALLTNINHHSLTDVDEPWKTMINRQLWLPTWFPWMTAWHDPGAQQARFFPQSRFGWCYPVLSPTITKHDTINIHRQTSACHRPFTINQWLAHHSPFTYHQPTTTNKPSASPSHIFTNHCPPLTIHPFTNINHQLNQHHHLTNDLPKIHPPPPGYHRRLGPRAPPPAVPAMCLVVFVAEGGDLQEAQDTQQRGLAMDGSRLISPRWFYGWWWC